MAATLFQTLVAFILTGVIGNWLAQTWQMRSARETRFFEASREMHTQMINAANDLSALIGKRLYASQRICLLKSHSTEFVEAVKTYRLAVIEWNEKLLSLELAIRTRFRDASLYEFEQLQLELSNTSRLVESVIQSQNIHSREVILSRLRGVRGRFFNFTNGMVNEARLLHRQTYFGVLVRYDKYEIDRMSTKHLIKLLFTSRVEGQAVVRSPADFGLPVGIRDARFGIYE